MDHIAHQLSAVGMSVSAAELHGQQFAALREVVRSPATDMSSFWVPGRIEFLGKHTDYAGGRSLLCAVERGIVLLAAPRSDNQLQVTDANTGNTMVCRIDPELIPAAGHWSNYPMTVARRIARNFPGPLRGADITFTSDLPLAAGLSSSSALVVAIFLALSDLNALKTTEAYQRNIHDTEELAGYLGAVENGQNFGDLAGDLGVGTFGGSEDHTAILCGRAGALVQYSFRPVRCERVIALPDAYTFIVGVSGVLAEKAGAARELYNRASLAARAVLDCWRQATGRNDATLGAALASSPDAAEHLRHILRDSDGAPFPPAVLRNRFEQFLTESTEIVPAAGNALEHCDIGRLGALVDLSMAGAEQLLGNQIPETVALARSARELGAVAASAFGAGFGGSVWALVRETDAAEFRARWAQCYLSDFPAHADRATFFSTRAGPAAVQLQL